MVKKILNLLQVGVLATSSYITSIAVLLIIIFLFKEGSGVFKKSLLEEGFVVAVNKSNPLNTISPTDIKNIFDQKITNWKEIGGNDHEIKLFSIDELANVYTEEQIGSDFEYMDTCINNYISNHPNVLAYFPERNVAKDFHGKMIKVGALGVFEFVKGKEWLPTARPVAQLGILPLLLGTLMVSLGAILLALPFGLVTAIYMAEIAHPVARKVLRPIIELLAGIPSVVYGFFGLIIVVPIVQKVFSLDVGETALAGSIVLAIMALPTIISIAEDAIRNVPNNMREASLALGATQWQTIRSVVIPYSKSGIMAGAILGIGRAIGETMAVLMVTGNASNMPTTFLQPVRTIPATIAAELGETANGGLHYSALFALGCILFLSTMALNLYVQLALKKRNG
jgi:phosphate transport system permease protein